jgi:putative hydrolase of the HAD superfamily
MEAIDVGCRRQGAVRAEAAGGKPMSQQFIIFNLDDTLAHCNKYFDEAIEQFADILQEHLPEGAASGEQIKEKQLELDLASVQVHGITSEHFPKSFVETYKYYCDHLGMKENAAFTRELADLGASVYEREVEPFPSMYETLDRLKDEGNELFLHTGGDPLIQHKKISQLQLAAYFDNRVFISTFKDTKALNKILAHYPFERSRTWMIGNSIRTDIVPGLELGINVIYIPAEREWQYNMVDVNVQPKGAYLTLKQLEEVPDAIEQYTRRNTIKH